MEDDKKPIKIEEEPDDFNDSNDNLSEKTVGTRQRSQKKKSTAGNHSVISGKTHSSYGSGKSNRSILGYTPIPQDCLDKSIEFLLGFLNYNILINAISQFPGSIIEHNGQELFEIITFFTGRTQFPFKAVIESHTMKRSDKVQKLYKQYDELIRTLKTEGALLNHIRPEFLLSYFDFILYVKSLPTEKTQNTAPAYLRMPANRY